MTNPTAQPQRSFSGHAGEVTWIAGIALVLAAGISFGEPAEVLAAPPGPSVLNEASLPGLLADHRHQVLVINFWATWCEPCVEEFPDLVRLHRRFRHRDDFAFISASLDEAGDWESKVEPFLAEQHARFPVLRVDPEDDNEFIGLVDKRWSGAIPATAIYDRSGGLRFFLVGAETYPHLRDLIKSLLGGSPPGQWAGGRPPAKWALPRQRVPWECARERATRLPGCWPRQAGPWECARERAICLPGCRLRIGYAADWHDERPWMRKEEKGCRILA